VGWDIAPSPCAISADGKRVAVTQVAPANPPATRWEVRVWEVEPRRVVQSLRQELRPAFVTFSPDGTRIVSAAPVDHRPHGGGEVFHLWDLATGTEALPAPSTKYNSFGPDSPPAAFSPDGSRLLVGDLTTFAVHDGRTGQLIADTSERQGAFPLGGRGPDLSALTFSANGRRVVVQNCGWFHVWDSASWAPITEWASGSDAVLSADGRRVAACYYSDESRTHYVAVRDVDTGRELIRIDTGGGSLVALSPDGRRVAAGFASDGYTAVWVVPEGKRP
jgi:WD40 repeat protein